MPKRTNLLQKIVFMVKHLVSEGATVTESKMLIDRITGTEREVDICIETEVGTHPVIISVECRGRSRLECVQWIEEMKAKHERLSTNVLVLVSGSGFSKESHAVARAYGIHLLELKRNFAENAKEIFNFPSHIAHRQIILTPHEVLFEVVSPEWLTGISKNYCMETFDVCSDTIIYSRSGNPIMNAHDIVEALFETDEVNSHVWGKKISQNQWFDLSCGTLLSNDGEPFFVKCNEPYAFCPIEAVFVSGPCKVSFSEFSMTPGTLGKIKLAWGEGLYLGKRAIVVSTFDSGGKLRLALDYKP